MGRSDSRLSALYFALCTVRIVCTFSPGYLHPDEWFQYGEPLAGDLLSANVVNTWEFDQGFPCRSMASLRLFGLPFLVAAKYADWIGSGKPSGQTLFCLQRATFLVYSFGCDILLHQILRKSKADDVSTQLARILFSGSASMLSFGVRPFSNNIEALLLAATLLIYTTMMNDRAFWSQKSSKRANGSQRAGILLPTLLGGVTALGIFSRFTFVIFAAPIAVDFLFRVALRDASMSYKIRTTLAVAVPSMLSFIFISILHIWYDTDHFSSGSYVVTPLNAALYNLRADNLARHGLHPNWLHFFVNAPLMLGAGPWPVMLSDSFSNKFFIGSYHSPGATRQTLRRLCVMLVITSILILSVQPHQEPRFLLPLSLPNSIVAGCALRERRLRTRRRTVLALMVLQAILSTSFYSFLHQGGIIPALLYLDNGAVTPDTDTIYVWRTFMPPRHLLPSLASAVRDVGGISGDHLRATVSGSLNASDLLLAPVWVVWQEREAMRLLNVSVESALHLFRWHLDMDHLGESLEVFREGGATVAKGFSYGLWTLTQR